MFMHTSNTGVCDYYYYYYDVDVIRMTGIYRVVKFYSVGLPVRF